MSASLILTLANPIPFAQVLQHTQAMLMELLKVKFVPRLIAVLPPRPSGSATTLEGSVVGTDFPGAYIRFEGDDESLASIGVFEGGRAGQELKVGIGTVPSSASHVLAAAIAIVVARLTGNVTIGDYGFRWIAQDDSTPEELINKLALHELQSDFSKAIELVYRKQAVHDR